MLNVQPEAKLKGILEISRSMAGTVEMDKLLPKILDTLFSRFSACRPGRAFCSRTPERGMMIPAAQKHRRAGEDSTVQA